MNPEAAPRLRPIAELNQLAPSEFAEALRPLFEAAGPLAEALHAERPFASYADLLDRAESVAGRLTTAAQIEVVSAHPRIGESADAVRQTSALSYREQGYANEAALPPDEVQRVYAALADLNRAYEQRFGFRFVVFVNGAAQVRDRQSPGRAATQPARCGTSDCAAGHVFDRPRPTTPG